MGAWSETSQAGTDLAISTAVTADDAVNVYTTEVLNYLLAGRKNPNGCTPKTTYFNSVSARMRLRTTAKAEAKVVGRGKIAQTLFAFIL